MKIYVPPLMLRDGLNMWAMWLLRVVVGIHIKKINFTGIIRIVSVGGLVPNKGYDYLQMVEIYSAANTNTSDVMVWWWSPGIWVS